MHRTIPALLGLAAALTLSLAMPVGAMAATKPQRPVLTEAAAGALLDRVQATVADDTRTTGRELTPALTRLAANYRSLSAEDRVAARGLLARPTTADAQDDGLLEYTVAEEPSLETTHFCIHYVGTTDDAPDLTDGGDAGTVPDYIDQMGSVFEFVYAKQNTDMGWREAKGDGTLGNEGGCAGANLVDVYVGEIGVDPGLYGYANVDTGQSGLQRTGYLVMDDDYAQFAPTPATAAMEVTAAHEYNHVLQFNYDVFNDTWLAESSATWMEEQVYPAHDDYLQYLGSWAAHSLVPITRHNASDVSYLRRYGSAVLHHDMAWAVSDPGIVRSVWEQGRTNPPSIGTWDYDSVLAGYGRTFINSFGEFAESTLYWRTHAAYPDGPEHPLVDVFDTLYPVGNATPPLTEAVLLDNTSFAVFDVDLSKQPAIMPKMKLIATSPFLVDVQLRVIGDIGGVATTRFARTSGGIRIVELESGAWDSVRVIAVGAEFQPLGGSTTCDCWRYRDNAYVTLATSTDFTLPNTTIRGAPRITGGRRFYFRSDEPAGALYFCRLDAGAWRACTSGKAYRPRPGRHTFSVKSADASLNKETTPARYSFTV